MVAKIVFTAIPNTTAAPSATRLPAPAPVANNNGITPSTKNGILIVEFARDYRKAGNPIREAAYEAGHVRLRPILMTSFTFVLGVMPLLIVSIFPCVCRKDTQIHHR